MDRELSRHHLKPVSRMTFLGVVFNGVHTFGCFKFIFLFVKGNIPYLHIES